MLSQSVARRDVQEGRLVRLLPEWEPDPFELYAVYPSRLTSSPKVRAFLQFVQKRLATDSLPKLEEHRAAGSCAAALRPGTDNRSRYRPRANNN